MNTTTQRISLFRGNSHRETECPDLKQIARDFKGSSFYNLFLLELQTFDSALKLFLTMPVSNDGMNCSFDASEYNQIADRIIIEIFKT